MEECYCDEDQGAGYTYQDEHGDCEVCCRVKNCDHRLMIFTTAQSYVVMCDAPGSADYLDYDECNPSNLECCIHKED